MRENVQGAKMKKLISLITFIVFISSPTSLMACDGDGGSGPHSGDKVQTQDK